MFTIFSNKRNMRRTFRTYLLSFLLLIFTVTAFVLSFSYRLIRDSITDEIVISQTNLLNEKSRVLDQFLDDIIETGYSIAFDSSVVVYGNQPDNNYLYNEIQSLLKTRDENFSPIISIELYVKERGDYISSEGALNPKNKGFRDHWQDLIESSDSHFIMTDVQTFMNIDNQPVPVVSYLQRISLSKDHNTGYLAIHIKEDSINQLIQSDLYESDLKSTYLVNNQGITLSSVDKSLLGSLYTYPHFDLIKDASYENGFITTNSQYDHRIISFVRSEKAPWFIITESSYQLVDNRIRPLLVGIITTGLIALGLAIIIAYFLTLRLYRPIRKLFIKARTFDRSEGNNELSVVSNIIDLLDHQQKELKKELYNNYPVLRERVLKDIITNRLSYNESIEGQLRQLDMELDDEQFCILIFDIDDYDSIHDKWSIEEMHTLFFAMKNIANEVIHVNDKGLSTDFERGQLVTLINFNDYVDVHDYLMSIGSTIQDTFKQLLDIETSVSIGSIYHKIEDCYLSYLEAKDILKYKAIFDNRLLYYDAYNMENIKNYYNPIKEFKILENCLAGGSEKEIQIQIDQIFTRLTSKNQLSYENTYKVINKLIDTLQFAIMDQGYSPGDIWGQGYQLYDHLKSRSSLKDIHAWILGIYLEAYRFFADNKKEGNSHVSHIMSYIESHYMEDIYLDLIADKVGLNVNYMSRVFKKERGQTVLEYINDIRINKSKVMLKDPDLAIKDIGLKVGFNSIHSFNRRFKADTGMTPGQWRRST